MKATRQRTAISEGLELARGFRSAQELHAELQLRGVKVGLATVYRTLQSLADAGDVDVVRREDGEVIYRRCDSSHHHHHLVCRSCGFSVEIDNDEIERWAERAATKHGFSNMSHDLELFGLCRSCTSTR